MASTKTTSESQPRGERGLKDASDAKEGYGPGIYYLRMAVFLLLNVLAGTAVVAVGSLALPLSFASATHSAYRGHIRVVLGAYVSFLLLLTSLFLPHSRFVISGDWARIRSDKKQVVISNHQIYPDWFYLFIFAWTRGCHYDIKVILIEILSRLPIFGQGMQLFEFIFMKQRFEKDKVNMARNLRTAARDAHPLWLLIFPEGTLNTPGNIQKSKDFAKKMNIPTHPHHCILPKVTGLHFCLQTLGSATRDLYDLTVGYSGITAQQTPYDAYLIDRCFFGGIYPREVHIHVRHHDVRALPGFGEVEAGTEEEKKARFEAWLRGVWLEKDERLAGFYRHGDMTTAKVPGAGAEEEEENVEKVVIPIEPKVLDWVVVGGLFVAGYVLTRFYVGIVFAGVASLLRLLWG
ncbi:acyltransferase-domain-containing protein [Chytriomyces sp. MP71]|nr:acyltransferase-domain-containing protein [Chytriomyces sp. MP71]